jgi:hypothetical protein
MLLPQHHAPVAYLSAVARLPVAGASRRSEGSIRGQCVWAARHGAGALAGHLLRVRLQEPCREHVASSLVGTLAGNSCKPWKPHDTLSCYSMPHITLSSHDIRWHDAM